MNWLDTAIELQAIAQTGLAYTKDKYDKERFERLRNIARDILADKAGLDKDLAFELFCGEEGYPTPKIDTRAAVIENDKILLVRENDGKWSLPGGWCDVTQTLSQNAAKEVKEEAGMDCVIEKVVAIQDRDKNNPPRFIYPICKVFFLARATGGSFKPNIETTASGFFAVDELPELSTGKVTKAQIQMCFDAKKDENWKVLFD
ncbi:MAG: NUDIX hydrolase [Clostridia bacterium]|nr:NUDIX hydrolase [Clostridia bacterium]